MTVKSEEMYLPIDLESSLGRIEDDSSDTMAAVDPGNRDADMMDCEPVMTRTCEQSPFEDDMKQDHQHMIPYPIAETDDEIQDRQRLGPSVGKILPPSQTSMSMETHQVDWVPEDMAPVENPVGDEFSLSTTEGESLAEEEELNFEDIQDRVSFWESSTDKEEVPSLHAQQNQITTSVTFSSHADESLI